MIRYNRINVCGSGAQQQSKPAAVAKTDHAKAVQSCEWKVTLSSYKRLPPQIVDANIDIDKCVVI